jgi:hypothetical protein
MLISGDRSASPTPLLLWSMGDSSVERSVLSGKSPSGLPTNHQVGGPAGFEDAISRLVVLYPAQVAASMVSFPAVYKRVIAHWRMIVFLLIFAFCAFPLIHPDKFVRSEVAVSVTFVMLIASQIFWVRRALDLGERFIPGKPRRAWLAVIASAVYLFFFVYSFTHRGVANLALGHLIGPADMRLRSVLMEGAFSWWLVGSVLGFGLVIVFWTVDRLARGAVWVYSRARDAAAAHVAAPKLAPIAVFSPARRRFLEQTVIALGATPFVASAYGLLYGRLDVEVTRRRIRLARLPKAFEGFASPSFPISTSALSCPQTRFDAASRSPIN